jgi:SNF family Na+-dependent transporter
MQTGAQLTAGFLLTLPFQQSFPSLDSFQRGLYLVLVLLAGITTLLVMTPVAVHRWISGEHVKERLVDTAHLALVAVLVTVSLLAIGMVVLIFDVVESRGFALTVGGVLLAVAAVLMLVVPKRLSRG